MRGDLRRTVEFLREIGLPVTVRVGAAGYLPRIDIVDGGLLVNPHCHVSNLLHEAGHLAIIPGQYRGRANGDVRVIIGAMLKEYLSLGHPDDPLPRAIMQTGDAEATAWAWAAGMHLGIAPTRIILNHQYEGTGAFVRMGLSMCQYMGINGMRHGGMCEMPGLRGRHGQDVYPKLKHWLQPVIPAIRGSSLSSARGYAPA